MMTGDDRLKKIRIILIQIKANPILYQQVKNARSTSIFGVPVWSVNALADMAPNSADPRLVIALIDELNALRREGYTVSGKALAEMPPRSLRGVPIYVMQKTIQIVFD